MEEENLHLLLIAIKNFFGKSCTPVLLPITLTPLKSRASKWLQQSPGWLMVHCVLMI